MRVLCSGTSDGFHLGKFQKVPQVENNAQSDGIGSVSGRG